MYLVKFTADEHQVGEVELHEFEEGADLKEVAKTAIETMYPEYDNIEILSVEEVN